MEQIQIQKLHERVQALEERDGNRHAETTPEATPPSQRKSGVPSTKLVRPSIMAPRYPVDDIMEREHCELITKCHNLALKVAVGYVLPRRRDGTFCCTPIPDGFAIVEVD